MAERIQSARLKGRPWMPRNALFIGGPLDGEVRDTQGADYYHTAWPFDMGTEESSSVTFSYHIRRFMICGHFIWLGILGNIPDEEMVFNAIMSKEAKDASEPAGEWINGEDGWQLVALPD